MTDERSPFGPSGIAGGPLTEVRALELAGGVLDICAAVVAYTEGATSEAVALHVRGLDALADPMHRDARAFVGEL